MTTIPIPPPTQDDVDKIWGLLEKRKEQAHAMAIDIAHRKSKDIIGKANMTERGVVNSFLMDWGFSIKRSLFLNVEIQPDYFSAVKDYTQKSLAKNEQYKDLNVELVAAEIIVSWF